MTDFSSDLGTTAGTGATTHYDGHDYSETGTANTDTFYVTRRATSTGGTATLVGNGVTLSGAAGDDHFGVNFAISASNGGTASSSDNVITVDGGEGNDGYYDYYYGYYYNYVTASLSASGAGSTAASTNDQFIVNAGTGSDYFNTYVNGQANGGASVAITGSSIEMTGDTGSDYLTGQFWVDATGTGSVATLSDTQISISGGADGDQLQAYFGGVAESGGDITVSGNHATVNGDAGADNLYGGIYAQAYGGDGTALVSHNSITFDTGADGGYVNAYIHAYTDYDGHSTASDNAIDITGGGGSDNVSATLYAYSYDYYSTTDGSASVTDNVVSVDTGGGSDTIYLNLQTYNYDYYADNADLQVVTGNLLTALGGDGVDRLTVSLTRYDYYGSADGIITDNVVTLDGGNDGDYLYANLTAGTENNQVTLIGGAGNDYFESYDQGSNSRLFVGGAGNDTIRDTQGQSTAQFSGAKTNYSITLNDDGSLTVTDLRDGSPDGTDTLWGVDVLRFSNGDFTPDGTRISGNSAPVGTGDTYSVAEDGTLTVAASGVLSNDSDDDDDALTAALVTGPTNGTLTLSADGSFVYTPNANYNGLDSFTYRPNDGDEAGNLTTVQITVTAVNDSPTVAAPVTAGTNEDAAPFSVDLLATAGDVDDAASTLGVANFVRTSGDGSGITLNGNSLDVDPGAYNYLGVGESAVVEYSYAVTDPNGGTTSQTATITIGGVNDGPTAVDDTLGTTPLTDEDHAASIGVAALLGNDTDPDTHDDLTVSSVAATSALGVAVTLNADGTISYNPVGTLDYLAAGQQVSDSFTYSISDGHGGTSIATATLTVVGVNDGPTAPIDTDSTGDGAGSVRASVPEDLAVGTAIGIDVNATDAEGDALQYYFRTSDGARTQTLGFFAIDALTGVITLASALNYELATSHPITVYATDGSLESSSSFTVAVQNVVEHLFTAGNDLVDFNLLPPGAYDIDGAEYDALAGDDSVILPTLATSALAGHAWNYATTFNAGSGNDTVQGRNGDDRIAGGLGNDVLRGDAGADTLSGDGGDDTLYGDAGNDRAEGGDGNDLIYGGAGNDTLIGGAGIDTIYGDGDDDSIDGGAGNDLLYGGLGNDSIAGGADNDLIQGNAGNDTLAGDAGNDSLYGGDGNDMLRGGEGDDQLLGELNDDFIYGGNGNDSLDGGTGNDRLFGGAGVDRLVGGSGNDILAGGAGADKLTGSDGKDIFIFTSSERGTTRTGAHDVITDFKQGEDRIDLSALYSGVTFGGVTAGTAAGAATLTGYRAIYFTDNGKTWLMGDTDGIAGADFAIELTGSYKLKTSDFLLTEANWSQDPLTNGLNYNHYHQDSAWL